MSGSNRADKLYGNDGLDTLNDLLKITGTFSATYSKSKAEVYFKVGTTSKAITLKNFTATTFHINDNTYGLNGKNKFVKK